MKKSDSKGTLTQNQIMSIIFDDKKPANKKKMKGIFEGHM
jgi:hypothetical protein